ncbi:hypothetical protein [Cryptosporangium aurantiacum]|uniref:hypothetical protein n=1 Tax=Cryptosporangium aurantiacum TaxID=134849 RepID=UPI001160F3AC|nr:hypothetical protein [Cryptosporangium aurantiacum]
MTLALTGCSDDSDSATKPAAVDQPAPSASPSPSEAPEARLLTAAEAKAALPALTDLPGSGWKATPVPAEDGDSQVEPASCAPLWNQVATDYSGYKPKIAVMENTGYTAEAPGSYTEVLFEVASWTNAADSALPIEAGASADQCASFSATEPDGTYPVTAKKLTPLALGEKQSAIQFTTTVEGITVYFSLYQFAVGHNLVSVLQSSTGADNPQTTFEPVIRGILADLKKA